MTPEERRAYNTAYNKVWRVANRERINALAKLRRKNNPEKARAKDKAYYRAHGEVVRARKKAYRKSGAARVAFLQREYSLTLAEYSILVCQAGGRCAICGKVAKLVIDHDHASGKVRGLLCDHCNTAIGLLGDDPTVLRKAITYLQAAPIQFDWPTGPDVDWRGLCP